MRVYRQKTNYIMNFRLLAIALLLFFSQLNADADIPPFPSKVGISAIDWYKENIAVLKFTKCSFHPTCSQYTKQSIQKYGLLKGSIMGCDRLMRCNHDLWVYQEVVIDGELKKYDPMR